MAFRFCLLVRMIKSCLLEFLLNKPLHFLFVSLLLLETFLLNLSLNLLHLVKSLRVNFLVKDCISNPFAITLGVVLNQVVDVFLILLEVGVFILLFFKWETSSLVFTHVLKDLFFVGLRYFLGKTGKVD